MPKAKKIVNSMIPVYGIDGTIEKNIDLPKEIFQQEKSLELLALYTRVYQANQRRGTASTKTRSEVTGSTRKIYRQKGTGRARHGDIKAPIFVGGGVVGGPKPRNYSLKLTKKQKKNALYSALSLKFKNKEILGLSDKFIKIEPKTKNIVDFLDKSKLEKGKKTIIVLEKDKKNLVLATRNLKDINVVGIRSINPFQILNSKQVLFIESSLDSLLKNKNEN